MVNKLETAPEETIGEGRCCHYWIIETPKGPTCEGVCQFCGAKKEFDSFGPDTWPRGEGSKPASADLPDLRVYGKQNRS